MASDAYKRKSGVGQGEMRGADMEGRRESMVR